MNTLRKKIIEIFSIGLLAIIITVSISAQNQVINNFFERYEDNDDFTTVFVSPRMFEMVAKVAGDELEGDLADVVSKLRGLQILTTKKEGLKYYKEAKSKISFNDYEVLVKVKDKGENVNIFSKGTGDIINELIVLVGGNDEFILMNFEGEIDVNKLAKIAKSLDIDGMENLELLAK